MNDNPVFNLIEKEITDNDVVLYMKGTPMFPKCGFSAIAVQVLEMTGVKYKSINVLDNMSLNDGVRAFSSWPQIPQLFVKGKFVGGSDVLRKMQENNEFLSFLKEQGVDSSDTKLENE
ncbi:MAG: Grx4 family monothiol glutaredoxin [Alphaproteobacteria bacterium]|nr:Grx4 family monothiol glutaredoxin [Alphaproteobacteria bacterium]